MARQRDLLSLTDIAEETGISYATLRNYALKYDREIPSEGTGRSTRYPRAAVKVFQRLRKESKPGRKPASALPAQASVPVPQERQETAPRVPPPATAGSGGLERELAAIRAHLGSIAESLTFLVSSQKNEALSAVAAPVAPAAPVPPAETAPAVVAPAVVEQERTQKENREGKEAKESEGHRRLHSMPKVWGQRGKRPD